ncbi:hypothetical protein [Algoriphagus limi]|uniref:DUF4382 domain-containing protein n=1 Tax=Algoriphagus limi TaxID=2975273 RepID=A0ABT2G227_9BACT|nr:hypothetical protein [Algoriphagus limi]MCS5489239.1 hypothetical protein [Algoriphagus limi]
MKNYQLVTIAVLVSLFSCGEKEEPVAIGSGDIQLGIGVKLSNSSTPNGRILEQGVRITSGFLQVKEVELEVEGRDDNGEFEREVSYRFPEIKKINFDEFSSDVDFFINIESGNYEEIEFEIDLIDHRSEPSIFLEGTFGKSDGSTIPLRLEVYGDDDDDLDFELELEGDDDKLFYIDEINNPLALMEINAENWFSGISQSELEDAEFTDGVLVISRDINSSIYYRILKKIEESSDIELELN